MTAIEKIREIDPYLASKMAEFAEPILIKSEEHMSYDSKANLADDSLDQQLYQSRSLIAKIEINKMLSEIKPLFFNSWFEHYDEYLELAYDMEFRNELVMSFGIQIGGPYQLPEEGEYFGEPIPFIIPTVERIAELNNIVGVEIVSEKKVLDRFLNIRLTADDKQMLEELIKVNGFVSQAEMIRILIRKAYRVKPTTAKSIKINASAEVRRLLKLKSKLEKRTLR